MKYHHPFCNSIHKPVEECKFCPEYFKKYPFIEGQTPTKLIKKHFPNVIILK